MQRRSNRASYTALGTVVDVGPEPLDFVELAFVVECADDEVEDVGGVEVTGAPVPLVTCKLHLGVNLYSHKQDSAFLPAKL